MRWTVVIRAGDYEETPRCVGPMFGCPYIGAERRPGVYRVTVTRKGFRQAVEDQVVVGMCGPAWVTQLNVTMEPN